MRRPSGLVLGALAWVAVVVAVAVATWVVIARAGQDVAQVATAPRVSPTAGSTDGPGPSTSRPTTSTRTTSTRTGTSMRTTTGRGTATASTPPPGGSVAGFTAAGGTVRAECVDGRPRVRSVTPRDGFSFEISRDETLEVTFRGGPGTEDEEIKVRCENGIPTRSSG